MKAQEKNQGRLQRKARIRAKISGTQAIPRASVFKSNVALYVQLIDDEARKTIVAASTLSMKGVKPNKEGAIQLAKELSKKALEKGITKIVFDRNGYSYHGNVKVFADSLREAGLQF